MLLNPYLMSSGVSSFDTNNQSGFLSSQVTHFQTMAGCHDTHIKQCSLQRCKSLKPFVSTETMREKKTSFPESHAWSLSRWD